MKNILQEKTSQILKIFVYTYIYICTYESHVTWKFEEDVKIGIRNGIMI